MPVQSYRPIYTSVDSVKVRLKGKVTFEEPGQVNPRAMPDELLGQLIVDAETAVEQDLRGRYAVPFRSKRSNTWEGLPDHSRRAVRSIVDTMSCVMILRESFGVGTHITAEGYLKNLTDQYDQLLRRLLGQDMEGQEFGERRFRRTPPLEDMLLSATNIADDGFKGAPLDANPRNPYSGGVNYAANQINDPSLGVYWFRGRIAPR